jgi:hypothetical protein
VAERTVSDRLYRYEELLALHLADSQLLKERLQEQQQVILALDGLQPDVGHEMLWVLRDCASGEVLLARSLLGATERDLALLLEEVAAMCRKLEIPIVGVITDGQHSIRKAVARALPGVPHQLCHFHYLREAAKLTLPHSNGLVEGKVNKLKLMGYGRAGFALLRQRVLHAL